MIFRSLFSKWFGSEKRRQLTNGRRLTGKPGARLHVEELEDRNLLAVVEPALAQIYQQYATSQNANAVASQPANVNLLEVANGQVMVMATASSAATVPALESELTALGGQDVLSSGVDAQALLPITAIPSLGSLPDLNFVEPAVNPQVALGPVAVEGSQAIQANLAQQYLGYTGAGETVGVISDSFNTSGNGSYLADQVSGALPGPSNPIPGQQTPINVLQDSPDGTDEGRAMLQIVHAVAPGANLAFATADVSEVGFADNIKNLAAPVNQGGAGANVIVDDVGYFDEPYFQDGVVAQAVNSVTANGVAYFSAAGNEANQSYEADFVAGTPLAPGAFPSANGAPAFLGGTPQQFAPGQDFQALTLPSGNQVLYSFQWVAPGGYASAGDPGTQTEMEIYLVNANTGKVLAGSNGNPNTSLQSTLGGDPTDILEYQNNTVHSQSLDLYLVWDTSQSNVAPTHLKYINFTDGAPSVTSISPDTQSSTNYGHSNAADMSAVGAADYTQTPVFGTNPAVLEFFSSSGGTPIYFSGTSGTPTANPVVRPHPDIVAPDGVPLTFDLGGDTEFFGTSAASPHAAAVAALMLQAHPSDTPDQIYAAMHNTALPMDSGPQNGDVIAGNPTPNFDVGYGFLQAPAAILALGGANTVTLTGTDTPNTFTIIKNGSIYDFEDDNVVVFSGLASSITNIVVDGSTPNDTLTVDESGGLIAAPITFDGDTNGANTLTIADSGALTSVTYNATGAGAGNFVVNGASADPISFNNLSPTFVTAAAGAVTINLPLMAQGALQAAAAGSDEIISSNSGFESMSFVNPTNSLIVNASGGASIIQLAALDSGFAPSSETLGGAAGDTFQLTNAAVPGTTSLTVNTATLDLNGFSPSIGGLEIAGGTIDSNFGTPTLTSATTIDATGGTSDVNLGGSNGLTMFGPGLLLLNAVNAFTGATTIDSGTLEVNGNIANSSSVTVSDTGTLTGLGTTGPVTVQSGGALAPGDAPGALTTGTLRFQSGSNFNVGIGGNTTGSYAQDHVTANPGTVTIANGTILNLAADSYTPRTGDQFTVLASDNGVISGNFTAGAGSDPGITGTTLGQGATISTNFLGSGLTATITYTSDSVVISVSSAGTTPTATGVVSSSQNNTSAYGNSVIFTATVTSGGSPVTTGTVSFDIDGVPYAPATGLTLNSNGQASFNISALDAATITPHDIQAQYFGTGVFEATDGDVLQTVNPATLTYAANTANRLYGGADPAFSGSVTGFVLGQNQATATTGTPIFSTTALANSNTGSYAINGAGLTADFGNYTFVQAAGNATAYTINAATLTYNANTANRLYGGADPAFSGSVTGFVLGQNQGTATTGTLTFGTTALANSNVGNYALNGSGLTADFGNYTFVQAAANASAYTINPATLTYNANAANRRYGGADPAFNGTVTGFVLGQNQGSATTGTLTFSTTALANSNVGSYAINGSDLTADFGNYTFVQAAGNASAYMVNPATLTYNANAANRLYGAVNPAFNGSVTGFVLGQNQGTATTGTLTFSTTALANSNVGSYAINGSGLTAKFGDYTFVQAAGNASAFTINPATLTYVANPASRAVGAANPTFTGTVTGFVLGQTQATATTGTLAFTSPATTGSPAGQYPIDGSGLTANFGNYVFVQAAANATALTVGAVVKMNQTISWNNPANIVYGTPLSATQLNATAPGALTYTPPAGTVLSAGLNQILTANAAATAVYNAASKSVFITVTKAPLTATAASQSIVFGSSVPTSAQLGTLVGVVNGDNLTATFSTTATASSNAGVYPITITINDPGSRLANYALTEIAGTLTITKASATVTLNAASLTATANGAAHAVTATTNAPGASTFTVTYNGSPTAPSAIGAYTVVATLNNANYSGSATGTLNIVSGVALSLNAASLTATYDGNPHAATATTNPAGQAVAFNYVNTTLGYNSSAPPTQIGSYTVTASLVSNPAVSAKGTLVIKPGAAAKFALIAPVGPISHGTPTTLTIQVEDQFGNATPQQNVPVFIAFTGGSQPGDTVSGLAPSVLTNAVGQAIFLSVDFKLAGTYTFLVTSPGLQNLMVQIVVS